MANYKCAMMALGILHIIDGILLPSLWGLSWAFYGVVYIVAAPVWGGILFLIPAGIAGIVASSGANHGAAMASKILNSLASVASVIIIVFSTLTIYNNARFTYFSGAMVTAICSLLFSIMELIISIIAGVYSRNILINQARSRSPVVVYGDGIVNPAMQYPGGQVQVQYAGPQSQGQYPGPPPQGQYPGPPPQGQYPGPPAQEQYQEVKEKY